MDISIIIGVIGLILTSVIVFLGGNRGILDFVLPAKLRFLCSQPLPSEGKMVQGIKLFNKGGKIADNVMISISYKESLIKDIQIEDENVKNPPIVDGGIGYNFVVLRFDKIPPIHRTTLRKPIIFSLTVLDLKSGPDVVIKYGVDKRATEQKNEYDRPLRDTIAIFIGICALLWIVFGNPIGIYAELAVTSFIIVNWIFSRRN